MWCQVRFRSLSEHCSNGCSDGARPVGCAIVLREPLNDEFNTTSQLVGVIGGRDNLAQHVGEAKELRVERSIAEELNELGLVSEQRVEERRREPIGIWLKTLPAVVTRRGAF